MNSDRHRLPWAADHALRLLKYGYRLGMIRGPVTWGRFLLARRPVRVKLPAFRAPVVVRPGSSDVWTFEKIFISHEYDLSAFHPVPKVIVDAGANVGYASVFFAERYPDARVLAIEPEATNYELLRRNTAAYENVTPIRGALWHRNAALTIENPSGEPWAFRVTEVDAGHARAIRGISVETLLAEYQITDVDILKIDIEGAEKEVFQPGSEAWLPKVGMLVVELHDWMRDGCGTAFYRATSGFPFRHFASGENVILVRHAVG